ncbi:unnamed protein product [Moneuplotes crassus]|uniref:Uncharacterized protein n=1 Tax=Euplotes crassus TaxID=5936 RepID=A0AAD1XV16_EUPCR|nr:unnamed protein product [Moneuplotes crassus]
MDKKKGIEESILKKGGKLQKQIQENLVEASTGRKYLLNISLLYASGLKNISLVDNIMKRNNFNLDYTILFSISQFPDQSRFNKLLAKPFIKEISECKLFFHNFKLTSKTLYRRNICNYLPLVTNKLFLSCILVPRNFLRKILQIGRHIDKFVFQYCYIRFDYFKLSDSIHYSTSTISIIQRSPAERKYWEQNPEKVSILLRAISQTDLKKSLKVFSFDIPEPKNYIQECSQALGILSSNPEN